MSHHTTRVAAALRARRLDHDKHGGGGGAVAGKPMTKAQRKEIIFNLQKKKKMSIMEEESKAHNSGDTRRAEALQKKMVAIDGVIQSVKSVKKPTKETMMQINNFVGN